MAQRLSKLTKKIAVLLWFMLVLSTTTAYGVNYCANQDVFNAELMSSDLSIEARINKLCTLLDGKYFNQGQYDGCGKKSSGHPANREHYCDSCYTENIVKTTWFKSMFGNVSTEQFPGSYSEGTIEYTRAGFSCLGFSHFAEWYIFNTPSHPTVNTSKIGTFAFNYSEIQSHARIGDILRLNNSHSVIYISSNSSGITVLDSNYVGTYNCMVKKHTISYGEYKKFTISRATNRNEFEAPVINGNAPVDLGTEFFALIRNQKADVFLTNQQSNIAGEPFTSKYAQIWKFTKLDNGAYSIISVLDNACVDVLGSSTDGGTNVYAYSGGYLGNPNQQFYIYYMDGAYYFSPAHSNGKNMLDMSLSTYNLELWGVGTDWAPQKFDIYIVKQINGTFPTDLGASFTAYIRNQGSDLYLTNQHSNIAGEPLNGTDTQEWRFTRLNNGSYSITSVNDNSSIDVWGSYTEGGTNVYAYDGGYLGNANQQFYVYSMYDAYYLCPAHSNGCNMLDMSLETHNLEIWGIGEDWAPQEFDILKTAYTVTYDCCGGTGGPPSQSKAAWMSLPLSTIVPSREGYEFKGWSTNINEDGNKYQPGDMYSGDSDLMLYAVWEVPEVTISNVSLNLESLSIRSGESATLIATILPAKASDVDVTWTTSSPSVATVQNGIVTGVGKGTATITAKVSDLTASCKVIVEETCHIDIIEYNNVLEVSPFGAAQGDLIIYAAYQDGRQEDVHMEVYQGKNITFTRNQDSDLVKIMLVDSGLRPLCSAWESN